MKSKTILVLLFSVFYSHVAKSDTIVCCQSDTLKLAFEYNNILYNENCNININDVLIISSDELVYVLLEPIDTNTALWLSRQKHDICEYISCNFSDNVTEITQDGHYLGQNPNEGYYTEFDVVIGDSIDLQNFHVLPLSGNPPSYSVSISDDFENYLWSNGDLTNLAVITEPDNYFLEAVNHCGQHFSGSISFADKAFDTGQFYTGQIEGQFVHYIDLDPDSTAHYYHGGIDPPYKNMLFDINMDGINDIDFRVEFGSGLGAWSTYFRVTPLNGCQIVTNGNHLIAARLSQNAALNNYLNYSASNNIILYDVYWIMDAVGCHTGLWQNANDYLAFRFPINEDTAFGWMKISFSTEWAELNLVIYDYAYYQEQSGINEVSSYSLELGPNPVVDKLNISSVHGIYSIQLFDVCGKPVYRQDYLEGLYTLDIHSFPSGIYFLVVDSKSDRQVQKVIKQF